MAEYRKAAHAEAETRKKIARLKRELHRKKQLQADTDTRRRRELQASTLRTSLDEIKGKHVSLAAASVDAANDAEVVALSELFNGQLLLGTERGSSGEAGVRATWYSCFNGVDTDHTGRIIFDEFLRAVRSTDHLNLGPSKLSDAKVLSLWKALDEDASGTLSAGEWGHFMKRGAPAATQSARQRLFQQRLAAQQMLSREMDVRAGRHLEAEFASERAATEAELRECSPQRLTHCMHSTCTLHALYMHSSHMHSTCTLHALYMHSSHMHSTCTLHALYMDSSHMHPRPCTLPYALSHMHPPICTLVHALSHMHSRPMHSPMCMQCCIQCTSCELSCVCGTGTRHSSPPYACACVAQVQVLGTLHRHMHVHVWYRYSALFNDALRRVMPPDDVANGWFKLFKAVDFNQSGLIDYFEYEAL